MKLTHYLYIIGALSIFTACDDDLTRPDAGIDDDAIALMAGISADSHDALTRSEGSSVLEETNHAKHLAFTEGTKAALQINGIWKGHSSEAVSIPTTATIGAETASDSKHNSIELSPKVYWNDFGTADPANMDPVVGNGREAGLTIYGVAVNGVTTAAEVSNWAALPWTVGSVTDGVVNQSTAGWSAKDLLISNNVKPEGPDNTYKFKEKSAGKVLEFKHAMSKITVVLKAGAGFEVEGSADRKFIKEPIVILHGFPTGGKVNIADGAFSDVGTIADVVTYRSNETWSSSGTVIRTALIFPTRDIGNIGTGDNDYILKISADDNIYYVTKDKLLAAMPADNKSMQSGVNYVLNITINKTEIKVTATIKEWIDVVAETEMPKINVTANVGSSIKNEQTLNIMDAFNLYLSDASSSTASTAYSYANTYTKPDAGADGETIWNEYEGIGSLYWPSHDTHYFMRGVIGDVQTAVNGKIPVNNTSYNYDYNSHLLVGAPVIEEGTMCGNSDHTQVDMSSGGICAREGKINLTFDYMMSQVEVRLKTNTEDGAKDAVNLIGAKVDVVDCYTKGSVDIHTKTVVDQNTKSSAYTLEHVSTEPIEYRHNTIVPQDLTNKDEEDLRFRITIFNKDDATKVDDIYYATIKSIKVKEPGDSVSKLITKWESGKHYIYTLDIRKTEVSITATITDWITVTAEENIWF